MYQRTGSFQDSAEVWASLKALALELPEEVWQDHRDKVLAALLTEQIRAAEAEQKLRLLEAIGKRIVDCRYGIAPLPDGQSGNSGDNELDDAIVHLQTVLTPQGARIGEAR